MLQAKPAGLCLKTERRSTNLRQIFLSYCFSVKGSLALELSDDMVLLNPDEINKFISNLKSRYESGQNQNKK